MDSNTLETQENELSHYLAHTLWKRKKTNSHIISHTLRDEIEIGEATSPSTVIHGGEEPAALGAGIVAEEIGDTFNGDFQWDNKLVGGGTDVLLQ